MIPELFSPPAVIKQCLPFAGWKVLKCCVHFLWSCRTAERSAFIDLQGRNEFGLRQTESTRTSISAGARGWGIVTPILGKNQKSAFLGKTLASYGIFVRQATPPPKIHYPRMLKNRAQIFQIVEMVGVKLYRIFFELNCLKETLGNLL